MQASKPNAKDNSEERMQTDPTEPPVRISEKHRRRLPLPSEATHFSVEGSVIELSTGQHAIVGITSEGKGFSEKVLLPRSRVFIDGSKLKGKEYLQEYFKVGETPNYVERLRPTIRMFECRSATI